MILQHILYGLEIEQDSLDGGHVEFCKGIENPIGIKCGPTSKADEDSNKSIVM